MAKTDRELFKTQQAGVFATSGAVDPGAEVAAVHTRSRDIWKVGTENAATNVAETAGFTVRNKSTVKAIKLATASSVANNSSDYLKVYVYKRTPSAGVAGSATLLGSWNSHTSAEGTITAHVPAAFDLVDNTDLDIAAGSVVTFHVGKFGSGVALAASTITVDLEEV